MKKIKQMLFVCVLFSGVARGQEISTSPVTNEEILNALYETRSEPVFSLGYAFGREDERRELEKFLSQKYEDYTGSRVRREVVEEIRIYLKTVGLSSATYAENYIRGEICR
jgi:hypothetical protein